jgi:hypothetical protein
VCPHYRVSTAEANSTVKGWATSLRSKSKQNWLRLSTMLTTPAGSTGDDDEDDDTPHRKKTKYEDDDSPPRKKIKQELDLKRVITTIMDNALAGVARSPATAARSDNAAQAKYEMLLKENLRGADAARSLERERSFAQQQQAAARDFFLKVASDPSIPADVKAEMMKALVGTLQVPVPQRSAVPAIADEPADKLLADKTAEQQLMLL